MRRSAHSRSWKADQSSRKVRKKTKLALLILVVLGAFLLLGRVFAIIHAIQQPVSGESVFAKRTYSWDGSSNINLAVRDGSNISVLSYNPLEQSVVVAAIPPQTYINVPGGYGSWRVSSVYQLGQDQPEPVGNRLLARSLGSFLGIPIDGFWEFRGSLSNRSPKEVVGELKNPFNMVGVLTDSRTDLGWLEFLKLISGLGKVRFDKVESLDLKDGGLLDSSKLADGSTVFVGDEPRIDRFAENFTDTRMQNERISVAIYNATSYPGLAEKAARIITNIGGDVIIESNANVSLDNTIVSVNDKVGDPNKTDSSYTLKRLKQIFGSACSDKKNCASLDCLVKSNDKLPLCQTSDPRVDESRAQINIILGKDFYQLF